MNKKILIATLGVVLFAACQKADGKVIEGTWEPLPSTAFVEINYGHDALEREALPKETPYIGVGKEPFSLPTPKPSVSPQEPRRATKGLSKVDGAILAKSYARSRLSGSQFVCIDNLFTRESHWNYKAQNKWSGAYGIPQALPGSKMASAGADWRTNPITQVKWGIRYVNVRYGSACGAWNHFQRKGWY